MKKVRRSFYTFADIVFAILLYTLLFLFHINNILFVCYLSRSNKCLPERQKGWWLRWDYTVNLSVLFIKAIEWQIIRYENCVPVSVFLLNNVKCIKCINKLPGITDTVIINKFNYLPLNYPWVFLKKFVLQDGEPYNEGEDEEPCVEEGEMARDVMCVQNNADVVREAL